MQTRQQGPSQREAPSGKGQVAGMLKSSQDPARSPWAVVSGPKITPQWAHTIAPSPTSKFHNDVPYPSNLGVPKHP